MKASGRRQSGLHTNVWFVGLAVGLIATFSITMCVGRAGSEWFKDEVAQSLMSVNGLDGILQSSSSQITKAAAAKEISKKVEVRAEETSIKQKLEDEAPHSDEHPNEAPPNENHDADEVVDCPIKLANGKSRPHLQKFTVLRIRDR